MKPAALVLGPLVACLLTPVASAQSPSAPAAIPRRDVTLTVGWLNGNTRGLTDSSSNNWYNQGLYGGALAGWHWSDHLKTEVEAGVTNRADFYAYRSLVVDNLQTYRASELTFRTTRLAIGQQYQFYRNVWFHPHVTAGADLIWKTTTEHVEAITVFDPQTRQTRALQPPRDTGPETTLAVRPFAEAGFKAYLTQRAFFRSDLRLTMHSGVEQVLLRCGFGVDF